MHAEHFLQNYVAGSGNKKFDIVCLTHHAFNTLPKQIEINVSYVCYWNVNWNTRILRLEGQTTNKIRNEPQKK